MINIDPFELECVREDIENDPSDYWLALATAVVYVSNQLELLGYPDGDVQDFLADVSEATLLQMS